MKRIAGTMVLLTSLGGCVSLTAPSGTAQKGTTDAKGASATAMAQSQQPHAMAHHVNPTWTANPEHHLPPQHVASRVPTPYSPLPAPPPMMRPQAPIPANHPLAMPQRGHVEPSYHSVATTIPVTQPPQTQPAQPNQLNLPPGMPMAMTPPSERQAYQPPVQPPRTSDRDVPSLATVADSMVKQVNFASKSPSPRPMPALPEPTQPIVDGKQGTSEPAKSMVTPTSGQKPSVPLMRLVNTKRITLNFEVKDVGPSGLSSVELWYTQDCRDWRKYDAPTQAQAYVIEVDEEGMYGFTLLAKSGIGLGKEPPKSGDQPQVWVIVDVSKPSVKLTEVVPANVGRTQQVTIGWQASDKNLGRQPISIFYAEQPEGPWKVVASNLDNTGKHVWQPPRGIARVHFKVEAIDLAGNLGAETSTQPVVLDNSMPSVSITNVDSAPIN